MQIKSQINRQVLHWVWDQVDIAVFYQVYDRVSAQGGRQLEDQIDDQLKQDIGEWYAD